MKAAAVVALASLLMASCRPDVGRSVDADTPLLAVSPGDSWVYQVHLAIPEGATSAGSAAVDTKFRRVRTYLGEVSAAKDLPATACFELVVPGFPTEREFVEIHDDHILMRGSLIMRPETTRPMWLEKPVPFVRAGMKPGDVVCDVKTPDAELTRKTEVLAREDITVPAGTYHCIRLLTTGRDGALILLRNVWFSPGHGIVREEKSRYQGDRLVFRETQELAEVHQK